MRTPLLTKLALMVLAAAPLSGRAAELAVPPSLDELLRTGPNSADNSGIPELRFNALKETAMTYGAQAGLAHRSLEIANKMRANEGNLDRVYSFQSLMLEGNVLPPVLTEADDVFDQQSDTVIRLISAAYRVDSPARFTYAPPTWRTYLSTDYTFDKSAISAVAPAGDKENALWKSYVTEGFKKGEEQADVIFKENFNRLKRDFEGMVRYRTLLAKGMVTKPYVASSHLGVTGRKDGHMNVAETILQITVTPEFVLDKKQWNTQPTGSLAERLKMASDPVAGREMVEKSGVVREGRGK